MKLKKILPIFLLCGLILIPAVPAAVSYMTDQPDDMLNPFTIAMDSTTTVVEIPGSRRARSSPLKRPYRLPIPAILTATHG